MIPWSLLPLHAAKLVWFQGCVAAVFGLVTMSVMLLPARKVPRLTLAIRDDGGDGEVFFRTELVLGQCNAIMAVCVLVALRFVKRDQPILAGASFALSAAIKPYALLFLPYLLLKRQFATFGVFLRVGRRQPAAAGCEFYGVGGNLGQLQRLDPDARPIDAGQPAQPGQRVVVGDVHEVGRAGVARLQPGARHDRRGGGMLSAAAAPRLARERAGIPGSGRASGCAAAVVAAGVGTTCCSWRRRRSCCSSNEWGDLPVAVRIVSGTALAVLALSVFDLMGRRAYASFMSVSSITVCALLALSSLAYIRMNRLA